MIVSEALERADALRPNAVPERQKVEWIMELDGTFAELMGIEAQPNIYPDKTTELLMPYPYDNVYHLYLMAMIDDANEETTLYANDMTVANSAISDARKWWVRTHKAVCHGPVRCM